MPARLSVSASRADGATEAGGLERGRVPHRRSARQDREAEAAQPDGIGWRIGQQSVQAKTQSEALAGLLNARLQRFPDRIPVIVEGVVTKKRRHIVKSPAAVYPERPDLGIKNPVQLSSGHCLGTDVSSGGKLRIAMKALSLRGLAWGTELELST